MPKLLDLNGRRVFWYPNDHNPAHVHVSSRGCEAKFRLNCPDGPVTLDRAWGYAHHECIAIQKELAPYVRWLCDRWESRT